MGESSPEYESVQDWFVESLAKLNDPNLPRRSPTLARIQQLVDDLGRPDRSYRIIHVTGTNGKSSTALMAASIARASGLKVGLFTSPHIVRLNERMLVDGAEISDEEFATLARAVLEINRRNRLDASFFELITAIGLAWFAEREVDVAVIEVGILGRWDATNVVNGDVAVITTIGADHLDYVGSVEQVARDKSGIIKPGSKVIVGNVKAEFRTIVSDTAASVGASSVFVLGNHFSGSRASDSVTLSTPRGCRIVLPWQLAGGFKVSNAALALAAVESLIGSRLDDDDVRRGIADADLPGRLEVLRRVPAIVLDGAHNSDAMAAVVGAIVTEFERGPWVVVYGAQAGHDWRSTMAELSTLHPVGLFVCEPPTNRAISADVVAAEAERLGLSATAFGSTSDACQAASTFDPIGANVLVTGSFSILNEARSACLDGAASGL